MDGPELHSICGHPCAHIFFDDLLLFIHFLGGEISFLFRATKTQIDNIATCLRLLTALGIPLDDVTASEIHQGNLKSILTVFFALSRYKQQQKLQHQQQQQQQQEMAK
jgi:hypothetical protein